MPKLIDRFAGDANRPALITALNRQHALQGLATAIDRLLPVVELQSFERGETIIEQDGTDNDIFLILAGAVHVSVSGRIVAHRFSHQHVGEMAMVDHSSKRSAKVVATEETVCAKVKEKDFSPVANDHPDIWRRIASEIGARLRQRGQIIRPPNASPHIFVGSSTEGVKVASELSRQLVLKSYTVHLWKDDVFKVSGTTIESLESELLVADFAVLVLSPDDVTISRKKKIAAPRDNVVFELGLFMGALTRLRTYIVSPNGIKLKIPTDLLGLTTLRYPEKGGALSARLEKACSEICDKIVFHGPR